MSVPDVSAEPTEPKLPEFPPGPPKSRRFSAGIVLYRWSSRGVQILAGHMGGPFWQRRDSGAWSIPKGGYEPADEPAQAAAIREFAEETGLSLPTTATYLDLGTVIQANDKEVRAWALEGELDPAEATSNTFTLEWPPDSGRYQSFPEFDQLDWLTVDRAQTALVRAQVTFVERLIEQLDAGTQQR